MPANLKRLFMILPFLSIGLTLNAASDGQWSRRDYSIGQKLGRCLVRGCMVFVGNIKAIGHSERQSGVEPNRAMSMTPFRLRVSEWLYGKPEQASEEVEAESVSEPSVSKTALGPWTVWQGVELKLGGELLVAKWTPQAQRPRYADKSENLAMVISDTTHFPMIRQIIAEHTRLAARPDEIRETSHLLTDSSDSALAGYLVTYLMERDAVLDPDRATLILSDVMTNEAIPVSEWKEISDWIVAEFYRLSESVRQAVAAKLFTAASSKDNSAFEAGISALLRLSNMQMLVRSPLDSVRKHQLLVNYRSLVAQGKAPPGLESQLTGGDSQ